MEENKSDANKPAPHPHHADGAAHHPAHKHHPKPTFAPIHVVIAVLIGVVLLFNAFQINSISKTLSGEAPEAPPKPEVSITLIEAECDECADLKQAIDAMKEDPSFTVDRSQVLDAQDPHSQKLMKDNAITRLPAIVIEGEIDTLTLEGFVKGDDALVYQAPAPYYDVKSGSVKGLVSVQTVLADEAVCPLCANMSRLGEQLTAVGVAVTSEKVYAADSADGKRLIEAYRLTKLPAVVLSSGLGEYTDIVADWDQAGDIAEDGSYVVRQATPPYYDLAAKKVRGLVTLISVTDATCTSCYNVSMHKAILTNFGLSIASEKQFDVAGTEGRNLVAQYNITLVPTIVVTGDVGLYPQLGQVWPQVGTVEKDGAYVFRNLVALQGAVYKDLATNKTVSAGAAQ